MTKEKSVNTNELASAKQIKLVVTDDVPEPNIKGDELASGEFVSKELASTEVASTGLAGSQSAREKHANEEPIDIEAQIANPDKVLKELPADEFFRVLEQSSPEQLQKLIQTFEKSARTTRGSKILNKIIDVPKEERSLLSIFLWWEWRRPLYNLAVGLAGLPSVILITLCFGYPLIVTVASGLCYLLMANICYSLGTPAEVVAKACWKEKAETYGPVLLTLGTIFSVLLTVAIEFLVLAFLLVNAVGNIF